MYRKLAIQQQFEQLSTRLLFIVFIVFFTVQHSCCRFIQFYLCTFVTSWIALPPPLWGATSGDLTKILGGLTPLPGRGVVANLDLGSASEIFGGTTMEGPKVPSEARRREAPKRRGGWGLGRGVVWGSGGYAPRKIFKKSTLKSRIFGPHKLDTPPKIAYPDALGGGR